MTRITYKNAVPNASGKYRVYNFGEIPRVWIAWAEDNSTELKEDTVMILKNSSGELNEALAGELFFDHINNLQHG